MIKFYDRDKKQLVELNTSDIKLITIEGIKSNIIRIDTLTESYYTTLIEFN